MPFASIRSFIAAASIAMVSYFAFIQEAPLETAELRGKVVLVTGASTGIGEQIAYQYASHGAKIFLLARRKDVLEKVAKKCLELGAEKAIPVPSDMGRAEDYQKVVQEVARHSPAGRLDHLVLNHKAVNKLGFWKGTAGNISHLEEVFRVNFFGYVALVSALMPLLEEARGSVGIVSSVAGRTNTLYLLPYSSSKHALDGFFGGWRIELEAANSPVTITYCTLGLIDTENAVTELKSIGFKSGLEKLAASSANDTALAIVTAVTRRRRELYFPYASSRFPLLFRWWVPELFDWATSYFLQSGNKF
ncbi:putative Hydroxysteroid 11-beta-dehydrogenase 1-like protein [Hypsibius exemplaris]|uniref:Hydroxysteroid 11-beta-dehydrogenase 1-like protein n=1 Tax=Hypsibius exemplaris TaxID=2072580 RepID=A0A1W0XC50_HYPEX|nr:putative Hydroxysteroid 11-beta-dehydrogenase 1-like protein [Hypsibius exemplaris]